MTLHERIEAMVWLGYQLKTWSTQLLVHDSPIREVINKTQKNNPWFTDDWLGMCFEAWAGALSEDKLHQWARRYPELNTSQRQKQIAVVMAGNIPLVGLHDAICVLLSGHQLIAKLSSKDKILLPDLVNSLLQNYPKLEAYIGFKQGDFSMPDALIATGSDTTRLHFVHSYPGIPKLLRGNRHALAVLTGKETQEDLEGLVIDINAYYGLGCRNVAHILTPSPAALEPLFSLLEKSSRNFPDPYSNTYRQNRAMLIQQGIDFTDCGQLLLIEDDRFASPLACVHWSVYANRLQIDRFIRQHSGRIQCIVSQDPTINQAIKPGLAQFPQLWDYADEIDTVHFLNQIGHG